MQSGVKHIGRRSCSGKLGWSQRRCCWPWFLRVRQALRRRAELASVLALHLRYMDTRLTATVMLHTRATRMRLHTATRIHTPIATRTHTFGVAGGAATGVIGAVVIIHIAITVIAAGTGTAVAGTGTAVAGVDIAAAALPELGTSPEADTLAEEATWAVVDAANVFSSS
jgi:hypothetical protein